MGETAIVILIVLAAVAHLCLRYVPRLRAWRHPAGGAAGCATGCGDCGGCPGTRGPKHGGH